MENVTLDEKTKDKTEQTIIGKILGWVFGVSFCLAIFSVGDKEVGAVGLWLATIGVLLLPPVNMRLRAKYHNLVKCHHGDKYGKNVINFGYAGIKILFMALLLIMIAAISPSGQDNTADTTNQEKQKTEVTKTQSENKPAPAKPKVSTEFRNALNKAQSYSESMHMSKRAIYEQLTSEYGEQFPADAAQ